MKEKSDTIQEADRAHKSDSESNNGQQQSAHSHSPSRRAFISAVAAGVVALPPLLSSQMAGEASAQEFERGVCFDWQQAEKAGRKPSNRRGECTHARFRIPAHPDNGDEARYPTRIGNYSKGLKHDPSTGEVTRPPTTRLTCDRQWDNADFDAMVTQGLFGSPAILFGSVVRSIHNRRTRLISREQTRTSLRCAPPRLSPAPKRPVRWWSCTGWRFCET